MNTKYALLAFTLFLFAATGLALQTTHSIDGSTVQTGQQIETQNPFEYKINLFNNPGPEGDSTDKTYSVQETVAQELELVSSNYSFDAVSSGDQTVYTFQVPVPFEETRELTAVFKNNSEQSQPAALSTQISHGDSIPDEFNAFVLRLTVPAIPEFGFLAIPIALVIGSYWFVRKNQKKQE